MKKIAMIPARLGSQRVPNKNLRLLNGKPMIAYIIEAAQAANAFDEIYINSEADIFKEIADDYGIQFYQRPDELASNETVNDEFAYNFIQHIPGDILFQLLPTSPLITREDVQGFVTMMLEQDLDTLVSVVKHQIACIYQQEPLNFTYTEKHISSQKMLPVQSYATGLMAWKYEQFIHNMKIHGGAYHGGYGKIGYYELKGLSTIDVDQEEDFILAEIGLQYRLQKESAPRRYYVSPTEKTDESVEVDVPEILRKDGVKVRDFDHENLPLVQLESIIQKMGTQQSWSYRIINTDNNSATLICHLPGEGNRPHYHPNWNEWWYIVRGQWRWEIEGKNMIVKAGDIVFIEKNKRHHIMAIGDEPAIRLAVSRGDVPHIYSTDQEDSQK